MANRVFSAEDYKKLSPEILKQLCKDRGLDSAGTPEELASRLATREWAKVPPTQKQLDYLFRLHRQKQVAISPEALRDKELASAEIERLRNLPNRR